MDGNVPVAPLALVGNDGGATPRRFSAGVPRQFFFVLRPRWNRIPRRHSTRYFRPRQGRFKRNALMARHSSATVGHTDPSLIRKLKPPGILLTKQERAQ